MSCNINLPVVAAVVAAVVGRGDGGPGGNAVDHDLDQWATEVDAFLDQTGLPCQAHPKHPKQRFPTLARHGPARQPGRDEAAH